MTSGPPTTPVRAAIAVTGTELLNGSIPDRNGPWLAERLGELGVEVSRITVVGDRPDDLRAVLQELRDGGIDLIVTTGGLGPTADDLTAEVVAEVTGRELVLDPAMESRITEQVEDFAKRARLDREALEVATRKQAMVPRGATALDPVGTAPGLVVPGDRYAVIVLPGPPRELRPMWPRAIEVEPVASSLARAGGVETMHLRLFGLPESELAAALREIAAEGVDLDRIELTTCLRKGEIEVDMRWRGEAGGVAEAVSGGLAARFSDRLYSTDGSTVDEIVFGLLEGRSIAIAESCTGGLLAARLTDPPGASGHFRGGMVTYSNRAKVEILGVDPGLIDRYGAVSHEVAAAMSEGAMTRTDSEVALSITGVAGPGGGTEEKPVGYVCFHARTAAGDEMARDPVIPGSRADIRERSALYAMHMLRQLLG